jgi:Protein of unknown function (DUF3048) N-terminal domain/Protein of unknown function (DUF3048) C-terminal domain
VNKPAKSRPASRARATSRGTKSKAKARRRRSGRRALGAALLVVLAAAGAVACEATQQKTASPAGTTTPAAPASTTPPPPPTWPLTGVQAESVAATRPALAVKIENSIDARPQTGLNSADMVWEEVVEGGISRFVAVYQSTLSPQIGPVRSVRPMDAAIAAPFHGLLAFSGGQKPYITRAKNAGVQTITMDSGAAGFHRISSRRAPHNVYADPSVLVGQADANHKVAPQPLFSFAQQPTAVASGAPANVLKVTMSGVEHPQWTWSATDGAWLRSESATPAKQADGQRLRATNVVVLRVDVVTTSAKDPAGNPVPETKLTGQGTATVASGGKTVSATWSKNGPADPVVLTTGNGSAVTLAPGTTWVELVPNSTGSVATA